MSTRVYNFSGAPPIEPRLYLTEKHLLQLAIYGTVACPYTPPTATVYPADGQVGRWTLHYDIIDPLSEQAWEEPWKFLTPLLAGMRARYDDYGTGQHWIWVLTDTVLNRDNNNNLRLAVWPD